MKKVLMILPREGFEEVEAVTPVDYLRRAGSQVTVAADASERRVVGGRVVRDTNIVTAEGPSRAIDFALALVEILHGAEITQKLRRELLLSIEV